MKIKLEEIAKAIDGKLVGNKDIVIEGVAGIESAKNGDITFIANPKYYSFLKKTAASAVLVSYDFVGADCKSTLVKCSNPTLDFSKVIALLFPVKIKAKHLGVHKSAVIGENVQLGKNVCVGANAVIADGVVIGENTEIGAGSYIGDNTSVGQDCLIFPNVTILDRVQIGNSVIIHSGSVISSDGFGFALEEAIYQKVPQVGIVVIEDNVEIGANVTIDRARFDKTVIGKGTKIDNLVQIGHNVQIGKNSVIVAQVGISGSTKIGNNVVLAGQVGIVGHIEIGNNVVIAARGVVTKNIPKGGVYSGYPAVPHMQAKKENVMLKKLPELYSRIKKLESHKLND